MSTPDPTKITQSFGTWKSPITAQMMAQGTRLSDVAWNSNGREVVWLEGRSDRGVLVCDPMNGHAPVDLTDDLSVRAKVGYGGGDFTVAGDVVFFVENKSGRIFRQPLFGGTAKPVTPGFGFAASPAVSPDGNWLVYVHSDGNDDCLAIIDTQGKLWPQKLAAGRDFYMQPTWSPDGKHVAFVAWDHPNMPWDGTCLSLVTLDFSGPLPLSAGITTVGGNDSTAILSPVFSPDGRTLAYISDETGWGNLYLYDIAAESFRPLTSETREFGQPAWVQGTSSFGFSPDGARIYAIVRENGIGRVVRIEVATGEITPVSVEGGLADYTMFSQLKMNPTRESFVAFATSTKIPSRIIIADFVAPATETGVDTASESAAPAVATAAKCRVLKRSMSERVPADFFADVEAVSWPISDGQQAHGLFYPPTNRHFTAEGLPPAVIQIHGGPTSAREAGFDGGVQFLTSRGYAVLQVNYRGSTGYGREYMLALRHKWGVFDVADAVSGAKFLAANQLADPDRMVIMGGSAGGYTVLRALTLHPGFFKAGVCLYGISDLFALAAETHKFESRYNDTLLGTLPADADVYRDRSPIFAADKMVDAVAVYQGAEDQVVPKNQSDKIVASLAARRVPHQYTVYEGEGHGWRKSETVVAFYESLDAFLKQFVIYA